MQETAQAIRLTRPTTRQSLAVPLVAGGVCVLGSGTGADLVLEDAGVAATHARLAWSNGDLVVEPIGTAAVAVNGKPVTTRTPVTAGDWLALGATVFQVGVARPEGPRPEPAATPKTAAPTATPTGAGRTTITIGRAPESDVTIPSPTVSRHHARLASDGGSWSIEDLSSTNGTFVGGQRITGRVPLRGGERIEFGSFAFVFQGGALHQLDGAGVIRVEARGLRKTVQDAATGTPKDLLAGIDLAILPGEFVGIFGTSGSGKSTLMDALNGRRPASEGAVLYNGTDLNAAFGLFKSTIGYVPQQDIVHRKITIRRALAYTARLRLPEDTSDAEIDGYIERVLARVGLAEKGDQPIDTPVPLSGGQLKRVSLAVELVSNPAVLFLDEATSGLDAGTDKRMMRLFADLAADQKTVICVTHTLENVDACHLVVVLFGGRLVYFGPPAGVLEHFGLKRLSDVYETLETKRADEWAAHYQTSSFHRDYVARRLEASTPAATTAAATTSLHAPRTSAWRQFAILTQRYVDLVLSDRRNLAILLAQAPLIGLFIGLVFHPGKTIAERAAAESQIAFMLVISAIWFGCLNAAREIVKELPIYARERSVNLRVGPYVASKLVPLAALCAVQCVALLGVVMALVAFPGDFFRRLLPLFATGLAATTMGLTVSALVTTADKAVALIPIILIPQVLLADAFVQLNDASEAVAKGSVIAYWGFDGMKATLESVVREATDPTGRILVPVRGDFGRDLFMLALFFVVFVAATFAALRLRDRSR